MIGLPRRGPPWWRVRIVNLLLLFIVLAPTYLFAVYAYHVYNAAHATAKYEVPEGVAGVVKVMENKGITFKGEQSMNVLVLGIDYNWTDATHLPYSKEARSDTMFVLHLERDGSRIGMLTIMRDLYIDLPDHHGRDKINDAYALGGVPLARKTIQQFLGVKIDHYVVLRIMGARKLVDALGGLDIDVEKTMNYDDNWGDLHVHLKKGWHHLNGAQAIGYARFRHDEESDFGRTRRQQQVVDALIKKLKQPQNYANPARLQALASLFHQYVETDLNVPQMLDLAWVYQNFDRKNFAKGLVAGTDGFVGDMSVLYPPDRASIRKLVRTVLGSPGQGLDPADVTVEVLNGSHVQGAATALGNKLQDAGYNVVRIADYSGSPPAASVVLVHPAEVSTEVPAGESPAPSGSPSALPSALPSPTPDPRAALQAAAAHLVPGVPVADASQDPDAALQGTAPGTMVTVVLGADWQPDGRVGTPQPPPVPRSTVTVLPPALEGPSPLPGQ